MLTIKHFLAIFQIFLLQVVAHVQGSLPGMTCNAGKYAAPVEGFGLYQTFPLKKLLMA